jgi:hypothetical protein
VRVIELLGPPGSGKSTLAERLGDVDGYVVVKDHELGDLPALLRAAAAAWPMLVHRPPPGVTRTRWVAWVGRVAGVDEVVRRRAHTRARLLVLDQGPAYTLGRMADACATGRASDWWHHRLVAYAALLDAVVLLDADPQTLRERVVGRAKEHAVLTLDERGSAEYLAEAAHGSRVVAAWLESAGVPVVRLDTARISPDDGCRALEDAVLGRATGTE